MAAPPFEVLAEVDLADAQHAGERRADRLAVDGGADLADPGLGLLGLGLDAVVLGLRDHPLVEHRRRARG